MFEESLLMKKYRQDHILRCREDYSEKIFHDILEDGIIRHNNCTYFKYFFDARSEPYENDNIGNEASINQFSAFDFCEYNDYFSISGINNVFVQSLFFSKRIYDLYNALKRDEILVCIISIDEEGDNVSWRVYQHRENGIPFLGNDWHDNIIQPVVMFKEKNDVIDFINILNA